MKGIILTLIALATISLKAEAQSKNEKATFGVDGVCKMCKDRIEKAALKTKGVKFASWDLDTGELYCIYNGKKTSVEKIKQALADAGHDTKDIKASDEAYNGIDECCRYRTLEKH